MAARWLPANYDGPRSAEDVAEDLRAIAHWPDTNQAHVAVQTPDGQARRWTGVLSVAASGIESRALSCRVDGEDAFLFRPDEFKSARLHTYDGADYYELVITTERTTIGLSDAYNGL